MFADATSGFIYFLPKCVFFNVTQLNYIKENIFCEEISVSLLYQVSASKYKIIMSNTKAMSRMLYIKIYNVYFN